MKRSADPIAGALVTETFEYDGGRQVTAYIPPDTPEAVVFASDGQLISQWGGVLEAADVPSTMIVGVHRLADETLRLHEYSPGFDPERFAAHETFVVEDVRRWTAPMPWSSAQKHRAPEPLPKMGSTRTVCPAVHLVRWRTRMPGGDV